MAANTPSTNAQDDLQARIVAGDPRALDELFRSSRDALGRYLASRCGNVTDAEDALQNTFESATRFIEGYRGEANPRSWLFRVAANACTRMRRGHKNTASLHVSIDDRPLIDEGLPNPEERVTSKVDAVFGAIEKLDPVDRKVILLRDGEGLSAKETAAALDLTEAAVKSRLFRARKAVREAADALPG
jgi:RNA polymerase sigma-70 factor (ECF subfamily)